MFYITINNPDDSECTKISRSNPLVYQNIAFKSVAPISQMLPYLSQRSHVAAVAAMLLNFPLLFTLRLPGPLSEDDSIPLKYIPSHEQRRTHSESVCYPRYGFHERLESHACLFWCDWGIMKPRGLGRGFLSWTRSTNLQCISFRPTTSSLE